MSTAGPLADALERTVATGAARLTFTTRFDFLVERAGTVARYPLDVWTDAGGRIRRVRVTASPLKVEHTLELDELGVTLAADQWTRLPVA